MNQFTIEELVLLGCWSGSRYQLIGAENAKNEGTIYLSQKIQDMIVNYCDHKGDNESITCRAGKFNRCEKCGKFYKEN